MPSDQVWTRYGAQGRSGKRQTPGNGTSDSNRARLNKTQAMQMPMVVIPSGVSNALHRRQKTAGMAMTRTGNTTATGGADNFDLGLAVGQETRKVLDQIVPARESISINNHLQTSLDSIVNQVASRQD